MHEEKGRCRPRASLSLNVVSIALDGTVKAVCTRIKTTRACTVTRGNHIKAFTVR